MGDAETILDDFDRLMQAGKREILRGGGLDPGQQNQHGPFEFDGHDGSSPNAPAELYMASSAAPAFASDATAWAAASSAPSR